MVKRRKAVTTIVPQGRYFFYVGIRLHRIPKWEEMIKKIENSD